MHQSRDIWVDPVTNPEHLKSRGRARDESMEDTDEDAQDAGFTLDTDPLVDGTMLEGYPPSKGCHFGPVSDETMLDGIDLVSQKCDVCSHDIKIYAKRNTIKQNLK